MAEETPKTPRVFRYIVRRPAPDGKGLEVVEDCRFIIVDNDNQMMDAEAARELNSKRQKEIPQGLELEIVEEPFEPSRGAPALTIACATPGCKGPGPKGATDRFCRTHGKPLSVTLTPATELDK